MTRWSTYLFFTAVLVSTVVQGQPVPDYKYITFKLYDSKGKIIYPDRTDISITFYYWNYTDTSKNPRAYNKNEVKFFIDQYEVVTGLLGKVVITIQQRNKKMIIHTRSSLDSISFLEGEYVFNEPYPAPFKIKTYNGACISNFNMNNYKIDSKFIPPKYSTDESKVSSTSNWDLCEKMSKQIEDMHGGKNWALNTCNTYYQSTYISMDDIIESRIVSIMKESTQSNTIRIYPIQKHIFLKHEYFYKDDKHDLSISTDSCMSWKKILSVLHTTYVNIVYFANEKKLGIDCNDFFLISDYNLMNWKYYVQNITYEEAIKTNSTLGIVLGCYNWYDNYYEYFYFSDKPFEEENQPQTVGQTKDSLKKIINDYTFFSISTKVTIEWLAKYKLSGQFCLSKFSNENYCICTVDSGVVTDWLVILGYDSLQIDSLYKTKLSLADNYFKKKDYERAKNIYQCASQLKSCEDYPKAKVKIINEMQTSPPDYEPKINTSCDTNKISNPDSKYNSLITQGDKSLKDNDPLASFVQYWQASKCKPNKKYPRQQMLLCDKKIIEQKISTH